MSNWVSVNEKLPEEGVEVLGYSYDWVDEDRCPNGTRICVYFGGEWTCAVWNDDHETYKSINVYPDFWMSLPTVLPDYMLKNSHIAQMVMEKKNLAEKLTKALNYYNEQKDLETYENELLHEQIGYMQKYIDTLQRRINYAYRKKFNEYSAISRTDKVDAYNYDYDTDCNKTSIGSK
jgi:hypothetical protein